MSFFFLKKNIQGKQIPRCSFGFAGTHMRGATTPLAIIIISK